MGANQSNNGQPPFGPKTTAKEIIDYYSGGELNFLKDKTAIVTGGMLATCQ